MAHVETPLTENEVKMAYEIFLRRQPENPTVVSNHVGKARTQNAFRETMLAAKEFYDRNYIEIFRYVVSSAPISGCLGIDVEVPDPELKLLFQHIQDVWSNLGATDPHFSVLSVNKFRAGSISENQKDFYDSGRSELEVTFRRLASLNLKANPEGTAIELGAGVGRVTRYLGERFAKVVGYDISANHLALASAYVADVGVENVEFQQLLSVETASFIEHDFFYSRLVLQHNPPPIIAHLLDRILSRTRPGGIVVFQLMTARVAYKFDTQTYIEGMASLDDQELHVLPQAEVFKLFAKHGIICVETFRDGALKGSDRTSMTFIGSKPA